MKPTTCKKVLTALNTLSWAWGSYSCFDWLSMDGSTAVHGHFLLPSLVNGSQLRKYYSLSISKLSWAWRFCVFFYLSTNPMKKRPKDQFILLTSIVCVTKAGYSPVEQSSIVVIKTIKNTSVSHAVGLGDKFRHRHEHEHCNLFWVDPTYSVTVLEILTRVQNVEIGPQLIALSFPVWFEFDEKRRYPAVSGKLQSP